MCSVGRWRSEGLIYYMYERCCDASRGRVGSAVMLSLSKEHSLGGYRLCLSNKMSILHVHVDTALEVCQPDLGNCRRGWSDNVCKVDMVDEFIVYQMSSAFQT